MRKSSAALAALALVTYGSAWAGEKDEIEMEKLAGAFPNLTINGFSPSPVGGLFEVTAGSQIFYFSPEGYLIFGEIWSKEGENITAARREQLAAEMVRQLPVQKGVRIGKGPVTVIEFTDPDCPFCRKTDEFLRQRQEVTRYVFLFPLRSHPDAADKAKLILCSDDQASAMHAVFSGEYDGKQIKLPVSCDADKRLQEHLALGGRLGVRGTPALWVNDTPVSGADLQRLATLINNAKTQPEGGRR